MTDDSWLCIFSVLSILKCHCPTNVWTSTVKTRMSDRDWIISLQYIPLTFDKNADKCFYFQVNPVVVDFTFWRSLWCLFYKVTNAIHPGSTLMTNHLSKIPPPHNITGGWNFTYEIQELTNILSITIPLVVSRPKIGKKRNHKTEGILTYKQTTLNIPQCKEKFWDSVL